MALRIATWNLCRKGPCSPTGRAAVQYLESVAPDVAVLTEARLDHLGSDWHHASSGPAFLPRHADDERKVVLASRKRLDDVVTEACDDTVPGRFVSAVTESDGRVVRVVGVCIPWHDSRVGSGSQRRWQDHRAFLGSLDSYLRTLNPQEPVVVAGDFNQRIPRSWQPKDLAAQLLDVLADFEVPTVGLVSGIDDQLIDHVAVRGLAVLSVRAWPRDAGGIAMSDHDGVVVEVVY